MRTVSDSRAYMCRGLFLCVAPWSDEFAQACTLATRPATSDSTPISGAHRCDAERARVRRTADDAHLDTHAHHDTVKRTRTDDVSAYPRDAMQQF